MTTSLSKIHTFVAAMLFALASSALGQDAEIKAPWVPLIDTPSGETIYFKPDNPSRPQPDPSWTLRTGIKKGIIDRAFEQEQFAGPDAAVLKNGFFGPWSSLLAEFREPSVLVDARRIAGLEKTKPYLIIPSGALHGFSGSEFFKAGLAEYARSGGVILCFAQQNGVDFTALPIPAGSRLEAAGWQQDAGPLFRASTIQGRHPMLAGTGKTTPELETSGYLTAYPNESKVVLSRQDGFPTLLVYPYGSGWVVVTTMFTDYSFDQGQLNRDEKILVRDLVLWAKAPAQLVEASPGERLSFPLSIQGPEQGEASSIKLMVIGPDNDRPLSEVLIKAPVKPDQVLALTFPYTVPLDLQPGLYHIEYLLLDNAGQSLSVRAETSEGRFSIGQPVVAAPIPRLLQPLSGAQALFSIQPALEGMGSALLLRLDLLPEPKTAVGTAQTYIIRAAGQEKSVSLGVDRKSLSFNVPEPLAGKALSFLVYHSSGRSLLRGAVPLSMAAGKSLTFDKPYYLPGQNITLTRTNLGDGELFLMAPGHFKKQMITGSGSASYTLPANLPAGSYRTEWNLTPLEGNVSHGEVLLNIAGYRVRVQDASLENKVDRTTVASTVRFRVHATHKLSAQMKLKLRGPDNTTTPVAEGPVLLSEGVQEVPFTFSFKPGAAGIWELHYAVEARLPEGPGFTREPVVIAAGHTLFDVGELALLGVATSKPVYYEQAAPIELSAYLFGLGKAKLELSLDNKKLLKERIDLAGPYTYTTSIPGADPGPHAVKAMVRGEELASIGESRFIYGARIPDLVGDLRTPEPTGLVMPVSINVKNQGKLSSGPSVVALYEGDPTKGGKLIARAEVPPLEPNTAHQAVIDWSLLKKAGARTLFAVVDADNVVVESNKGNNTVSTEVKIPEALLSVTPGKNSFGADENITFSLFAANLSSTSYKDLDLKIELVGPAGNALFTETLPFTEFAPGSGGKIDRSISLAPLPTGTYQLRAQLAHTTVLAAVSSDISILPTLMLQGSFEGTPETAALCMPFTIRYRVKNTGNLPITAGALKLEIKPSGAGQPVYARQLPLSLDAQSLMLDKMDFPKGSYGITLKASAMNQGLQTTREFMLAEKPLLVTDPIIVKKENGAIPRVLLWLDKNGTTVQQAVADKIAKQAFEDESVYYTIVNKAEDFTNQSMSGLYNTYVLFEPDELLERADRLRDRISQGQGLVIIGAEDRTRMIAETFGFTFSEITASTGAMLMFTEDLGLGLSGNMPISGRMLLPRKNGARPAALFTGDKKPAALIDMTGSGRVMVMPFALSRSALDTGATSLYSLLLRTAVRNVAPGTDEQTAVSAQELSISARTGPVKARIVVTVPEGGRIVWANTGGAIRNNAVVYELIADQEAQKLLFLYQLPEGGKKRTVVEPFYECGERFVGQGKIE